MEQEKLEVLLGGGLIEKDNGAEWARSRKLCKYLPHALLTISCYCFDVSLLCEGLFCFILFYFVLFCFLFYCLCLLYLSINSK